MFIPDHAPETLAEMYAFLLPSVGDGLFDDVSFDDPDNPTKLVCTQNGHPVAAMTVVNNDWIIAPYAAQGSSAEYYRSFNGYPLATVMRCTGGICFTSVSDSGSRHVFVIAKTSDGQTGCLYFTHLITFYPDDRLTFYPTCFGDNTALALYSHGFVVSGNLGSADRTILTRLPVVGQRGSTGFFSGVFMRNVMQFNDNGEQIIGGKHYGCLYHIALLDEESA